MNRKKIVSCVLFLSAIGLSQIFAQGNINSTGGKATGTDGTVNFSVGQTVFNTFSSETGTISEGVQQPYEIFITTGIELITINLGLKVFPNPTTNILNLTVENNDNELSYQLFNNDGKMLKYEKIDSKETQIEMLDLLPASYFLRVIENDQIVKSFKIIKN